MSWGTAIDIGTAIWGASEASSANSANAAYQKAMMEIQQEMLDMAKLREDYDSEMREDQKKQIEEYQATLNDLFHRLGARDQVTMGSINADANTYYDQNMSDINRSIDRVNSQGYASGRAYGMGDSTVNDDRKRELTEQYYDLTQKAKTDAYDRAFQKASGAESLINTNRANITNEYDNYFSKPFSMMDVARKSDGANALNSAGNLASTGSTNAAETALMANKELGNIASDIRDRYFPDDKDDD
jgi:hypothetical protein